jgi:hypothetical protein
MPHNQLPLLTIQVYTFPYSQSFSCIFSLAHSSSLKINKTQSKINKLRKPQNKRKLGVEEDEKRKLK